jgi:hypothetical protein
MARLKFTKGTFNMKRAYNDSFPEISTELHELD